MACTCADRAIKNTVIRFVDVNNCPILQQVPHDQLLTVNRRRRSLTYSTGKRLPELELNLNKLTRT